MTETMPTHVIGRVGRAIERTRWSIITIAAVYTLSVLIGLVMVHSGNNFALTYGDQWVRDAGQTATAQAAQQGDNLRAALRDFAGNLVLGAAPRTLMGFGVVFPYPWVAYQGWVGGSCLCAAITPAG